MRKKNKYTKVVEESYKISKKRGGGIIKIEAWEDKSGTMIKYSIAYINHDLYSGDNGRVIGYDNSHGYHHQHHFGDIAPVTDFVSYEDIVERFEREIEAYLK